MTSETAGTGRGVRRDSVGDDLELLIEAFGLGEVRGTRFLADGLMNRNWRIETGRGTFALKQVIDVPLGKARRNFAVLAGLAVDGVPACPPVAGVAGDLVVEIGGHGYSLFPWVEGAHIEGVSLDLAQVAELGILLGRIHQGLGRVGSAAGLPALPEAVPAKVTAVEAAIADADRFLEVIATLESPTSFDLAAVSALEDRKILLERYISERPMGEVPLGQFGWTHGDVQHRNLLWRGGAIVAVLDWDRLGVRPYAEEVVRTAQVQFGGRGRFDLERVAVFVAAYRSVIDLAEEDLVDAVDRLWWKRMTDFWQLQWHYDKDDHGPDELWVSGERLLSWWTGHREQVRSVFAARTKGGPYCIA